MIAATLLGLLFVPLFFVVVKRIFKDRPAAVAPGARHAPAGQAAE
jgi:multidrug efflux pump